MTNFEHQVEAMVLAAEGERQIGRAIARSVRAAFSKLRHALTARGLRGYVNRIDKAYPTEELWP
jgi:hypothetical protein